MYFTTESNGVIAVSSAGERVPRMLSTFSATESSAADAAFFVASTALFAALAALSTTLSFSSCCGMYSFMVALRWGSIHGRKLSRVLTV